MYLSYSKDGQYASAVRRGTKAEGGGYEAIWLGKVLDKERGIYESGERGIVHFDIRTGAFSDPPEDFVPGSGLSSAPGPCPRERPVMTLRFAGTWFTCQFLATSGLMDILPSTPGHPRDTMLALLLFYLTGGSADGDVSFWYRHNIARFLFPDADLGAESIRGFLASFGTQENVYSFFFTFLEFLREKYGSGDCLLADATVLPGSMDVPFARAITEYGGGIADRKMAVAVQRATGVPVFYEFFHGDTMDHSTLQTILIRLKHLGADLKSVLMDCGFNTPDNLELLYNGDGSCKIPFITRVKSGDADLVREILNGLDDLIDKKNFVTCKEKVFFIAGSPVKVGANRDRAAWLYYGTEVNRRAMESLNTARNALKRNVPPDRVYEKLCDSGFFGLLSSDLYDGKDLLPAYCERISAEQIINCMRNRAWPLPAESRSGDTVRGHVFLSFLASVVTRLAQIGLKDSELDAGSALRTLNHSGAAQFRDAIVPDPLEPEVREVYEAFGMEYPAEFPLIDGRLVLRDSAT